MKNIKVKILDEKIGNSIPLPEIMTDGSAGMDLRYCPPKGLDKPLFLKVDHKMLLPTGVSIHIDDPTLAGFIFPRSSMAFKRGLVLANSVGVIDSDYQGPLMVAAQNKSNTGATIEIKPGDRIAQLVIMPVVQCQLEITSHFEESERGQGGFGSTGVE